MTRRRWCSPVRRSTGPADSAFRVVNLWCLFFNRRSLESWRIIFRINLAPLRGRILDSQAGQFGFCAQSIDFAILEVPNWAGVIQLAECQFPAQSFISQ